MQPVIYPLNGKRVFVAGHRGMVGSAVVRRLQKLDCEILTVAHKEVDLRRQAETEAWLAAKRPDTIFVAAATVGGILANDTRPAEFLYDNMMIEGNLIEGARRIGVKKLLFLGSSCIYPRLAPQPMKEEHLLTGALEPTNQWYAIAKIAGLKLCAAYRRQHGCDFISAQPTNLYGPGDTYNLQASHVIPALLAKMHVAKITNAAEVEIWGTGNPRREFLHVDDLADALVFLMERYSDESHVNIGWGDDVSIADLATLTADTVGFKGRLRYATDKPDGMPRKLLDVSMLKGIGWQPTIALRDGLADAYRWFVENAAAKFAAA
ncbi:MAG TPA: GDP-L-fucose synthase [Stellaceae bacterium]|jgi:GDP-L-fucose synthase|nr:GDP-L-fucose synthase [Stellaceae bacterium]